jgi:hypothetical protein
MTGDWQELFQFLSTFEISDSKQDSKQVWEDPAFQQCRAWFERHIQVHSPVQPSTTLRSTPPATTPQVPELDDQPSLASILVEHSSECTVWQDHQGILITYNLAFEKEFHTADQPTWQGFFPSNQQLPKHLQT